MVTGEPYGLGVLEGGEHSPVNYSIYTLFMGGRSVPIMRAFEETFARRNYTGQAPGEGRKDKYSFYVLVRVFLHLPALAVTLERCNRRFGLKNNLGPRT